MKASYGYFSVLFFVFLISCNEEEGITAEDERPNIVLNNATTAEDGSGNLYRIGFNQVSSINQDPFVSKTTASGETKWYIEHEKSEVDVRANLIFIDDTDTPWVVFSVVGGSNSAEYITKRALQSDEAFSGVYQRNYGNGGGPKVSVLAKLDPETGKIEKATYMLAKKNDGKTNGLNIKSLGMNGDKLAFEAESVAWPPTIGTSYVRYPDITDADRVDGVFKMYYEMDTQLREITKAVLEK